MTKRPVIIDCDTGVDDACALLIALQSEELLIRAQVQSPLEVLQSATLVGAEILGQAGVLGEITPGARADLLLVDGDPLRDLACLTGQGERIALVMQGGHVRVQRMAV